MVTALPYVKNALPCLSHFVVVAAVVEDHFSAANRSSHLLTRPRKPMGYQKS